MSSEGVLVWSLLALPSQEALWFARCLAPLPFLLYMPWQIYMYVHAVKLIWIYLRYKTSFRGNSDEIPYKPCAVGRKVQSWRISICNIIISRGFSWFFSNWNKFHEIHGGVQTYVDSCSEEHWWISGTSFNVIVWSYTVCSPSDDQVSTCPTNICLMFVAPSNFIGSN